MSTVQRAVYINEVEPSPMSLRVPSGMETLLTVTFLRSRARPRPTSWHNSS